MQFQKDKQEYKDIILFPRYLSLKIPQQWDSVHLSNITEKISDRDHTTPIYLEDGVPIVSPTNFNDDMELDLKNVKYISKEDHKKNYSKTDIRPHDIIFSRIGSVGKSYLVKDNFFNFSILHSLCQIRTNDKILPIFLLWFLRSNLIQKRIWVTIQSIGVPDLGLKEIGNLPILLPPLSEQQKIATILSNVNAIILSLDDLIQKNKILNKILLKKAFSGELTKTWRKKNENLNSASNFLEKIKKSIKIEQRKNVKILNGTTKTKHSKTNVFNENEPTLSIPKNWIWCRLADLMVYLTDYHANASYAILKKHVSLLDQPDYACMIRSTNFEKNNFDSLMKYITKDAYEFLWKSQLFGGEILIGKIGNAGSVYLMPSLNKPASLAMNLFAVKISSQINSKYVFYHFLSSFSEKDIQQHVKGLSTPSIDKKSVRSLWIALPPEMELKVIIEVFSNIDKTIKILKEHKKKIEYIKNGLMQKLLTGQIRVKV